MGVKCEKRAWILFVGNENMDSVDSNTSNLSRARAIAEASTLVGVILIKLLYNIATIFDYILSLNNVVPIFRGLPFS